MNANPERMILWYRADLGLPKKEACGGIDFDLHPPSFK
jgi:hypothetical protein